MWHLFQEFLNESKIQKEHIILIFQIIHARGNIVTLLRIGLDYSDISKIITYLKEKEYVKYEDGKLKITPSGFDIFVKLNTELKRRKSEIWISPDFMRRIDKRKKYDIYLPSKKINLNS